MKPLLIHDNKAFLASLVKILYRNQLLVIFILLPLTVKNTFRESWLSIINGHGTKSRTWIEINQVLLRDVTLNPLKKAYVS